MRVISACIVAALLAGCGTFDPDDNDEDFDGAYTLVSIDGAPLPAQIGTNWVISNDVTFMGRRYVSVIVTTFNRNDPATYQEQTIRGSVTAQDGTLWLTSDDGITGTFERVDSITLRSISGLDTELIYELRR